MKYIISVITILLSTMLHAGCIVPDKLDGLNFINVITGHHSKSNPYQGAIEFVSYKNGKYIEHFTNRDLPPFEGFYKYKVLDRKHGIAVIYGYEKKPLLKPSHTILLKCDGILYGTGIFTQQKGVNEPFVRQNTLSYSIIRGTPYSIP